MILWRAFNRLELPAEVLTDLLVGDEKRFYMAFPNVATDPEQHRCRILYGPLSMLPAIFNRKPGVWLPNMPEDATIRSVWEWDGTFYLLVHSCSYSVAEQQEPWPKEKLEVYGESPLRVYKGLSPTEQQRKWIENYYKTIYLNPRFLRL